MNLVSMDCCVDEAKTFAEAHWEEIEESYVSMQNRDKKKWKIMKNMIFKYLSYVSEGGIG